LNISPPWQKNGLREIHIRGRGEWSKKSARLREAASAKPGPARPRIAWLIPHGDPFVLARGAYAQYVSTAKGRERCWRLFSTFPGWASMAQLECSQEIEKRFGKLKMVC